MNRELYRETFSRLRASDQAKEELMNMTEEGKTGKVRTFKAARTALIAAALAVGCLVLCAAGWIGYTSATGAQRYQDGAYEVFSALNAESPVEVREGRLWFIADGQEVDITDQISEDTPYIYTVEDGNAGFIDHVIVGGTVEDYGYANIIVDLNGEPGNDLYYVDGGASWAQGAATAERADALDKEHPEEFKPWFLAAVDQLGLEWE